MPKVNGTPSTRSAGSLRIFPEGGDEVLSKMGNRAGLFWPTAKFSIFETALRHSNLPSIDRLPAGRPLPFARAGRRQRGGPIGKTPSRPAASKTPFPEGLRYFGKAGGREGGFTLGRVPAGQWMGTDSYPPIPPHRFSGGFQMGGPSPVWSGVRGHGRPRGKGWMEIIPPLLRDISIQGEGPRSKAVFIGAFPPKRNRLAFSLVL